MVKGKKAQQIPVMSQKNQSELNLNSNEESKHSQHEEAIVEQKHENSQPLLTKDSLKAIQQIPKNPEISWPQVLKEYIENYPFMDPDEIGKKIRKDYHLTLKKTFDSRAHKDVTKKQIEAFNKAFSRAKNMKEGSIRFDMQRTNQSSNKKQTIIQAASDLNSIADFDFSEHIQLNNEHIPESQVSKRQKVGDNLEKKITKSVVEHLRVLIDKRIDQLDVEEEQHFSPSSFIKENPMVTLSKELAEITTKGQQASIAIEESEAKIKELKTLYQERVDQLKKEMEEKVEAIEKSMIEMKEQHIKILTRSSEITNTINETIIATNKHHNYQ